MEFMISEAAKEQLMRQFGNKTVRIFPKIRT